MKGIGVFLALALLTPIPAIARAMETLVSERSVTVAESPPPLEVQDSQSTTTFMTTTTATLPPTTIEITTTVLSWHYVPTPGAARVWAIDAQRYAERQGWPFSETPGLHPVSEMGYPYDISGITAYAGRMCQELVDGTEAQVEAHMRVDLGIERWQTYGVAWFDSLVNGLCIRP